jgi:mannose-6-phosphate isomerase-like protein (cupin superfamily)
LGIRQAKFYTPHIALAWLVYQTKKAATAGLGTRHRLHLHEQSWEYYVVIRGEKVLQIEEELVRIKAGELVEIPPGVKHCLADRTAPFVGFTFRAPILEDKVEF